MSDNGQAPAAEKPWQELEEDSRQSDATGLGLKVTYDGKIYQFHFGELSGLDVLEMRRQTGYTVKQLLQTAAGTPDVDTVAVIMWMSRRIAGDTLLQFADVAREVKWRQRLLVDLADAVPEAPAPVTDATTGEAAHPQA